MIKHRYALFDPSPRELWFRMFAGEIDAAAEARNWAGAQQKAETWARGVSAELRLSRHRVWKEFKRALVGRWFGSPERKVFPASWEMDHLMAYIRQFEGRNVRVSSFPAGIACHAESLRLLAGDYASWSEKLEALDRRVLVEAFPESSTPRSICFRRYTTGFAEEIVYEAGRGQAMAVFESEQGRHPMVSARGGVGGEFHFTAVNESVAPAVVVGIREQLQALIRGFDRVFQIKCATLGRMTGIEWTSIEGYFDPSSARPITIVDLDLPFDYVFMGSSEDGLQISH